MESQIIEIEHLSKTHERDRLRALDDVSLAAGHGIFGLLHPA